MIKKISQCLYLKRILCYLVFCILLICVPSCVIHQNSKRFYNGKLRALNQVCLLRLDNGILINEIDRKSMRVAMNEVLELLPGKHTLLIDISKKRPLVNAFRRNETIYWKKPLSFDFTYIAGNLYYLRFEKDPETLDWKFVAHNVTDWPEVSFLFEQYLKQRSAQTE